jgi:hypothetical protein
MAGGLLGPESELQIVMVFPVHITVSMKTLLILLFSVFIGDAYSQADTVPVIRVNFLYGSKPKRKFKETEVKYFGGLHGGHASIQAGDKDYGFEPTSSRIHLFPKRHKQSAFSMRELNGQSRYNSDSKTVTFVIPVSQKQLAMLDSMHTAYCKLPPYDYAFFGMRCAAATQDILSCVGLMKKKSRMATVLTAFYPKRLRRRLYKLAKERGYQVIRTEGKATRTWEKD